MQTPSEPAPSLVSVIACGPSADAWPIEVGWAPGDGEVRSMLICPVPDWPLHVWDKGCETQHRIPLETLLREGKQPLDACLVLNASLGGREVLSSCPEHHSVWLFKLYRAAGVEPNFRFAQAPAPNGCKVMRAREEIVALQTAVGIPQSA